MQQAARESVEDGACQQSLFLEGREAGRADALGLVLLPAPPVEYHGPPHRERRLLLGRPEVVVVERTPCSPRIADRVAALVGERARGVRPPPPALRREPAA